MKQTLLTICLILFALPSWVVCDARAEVTVFDTDDSASLYGGNIPQFIKPDPNYETMKYYLLQELNDKKVFSQHSVKPSRTPLKFNTTLRSHPFLTNQMKTTGLISYLYYEDGNIVYDELSPKEVFGFIINNDTALWSHSVGKSLVSYVLGHAICEG